MPAQVSGSESPVKGRLMSFPCYRRAISPLPTMTEFYVKVEPGSEEFSVDSSGTYPSIRLRSEAEEGRANAELVRQLSEILGCDVGIVKGKRSRRKKLVADLPKKEIQRKLEHYPG